VWRDVLVFCLVSIDAGAPVTILAHHKSFRAKSSHDAFFVAGVRGGAACAEGQCQVF
jgi:hypothetical protein